VDESNIEQLKPAKTDSLKSNLWDEIECRNSLYMFKQTNRFRIHIFIITNSTRFEYIIQLFIFLSSMKLVWDTYILDLDENSTEVQTSKAMDYCFTILFTLESIAKSIGMGFWMDKGSYLRESWNKLDFFIVIFSWIELMVDQINIPVIKILRLLRTLRPLRFISHN
jgi:hypothetical protein